VENEREARVIAQRFLDEEIQSKSRYELVLTDVLEFPHCWVVGFNARQFVETGDFRHALAGGGPIIVNRRTGAVRQGVSAKPIEEQLDQE
jgi:Immunity protein 35